MHRTQDRWQVYGLDVAGIGLVANYRTQFSKIIRTESHETLVTRLESHQTDLLAPSVSSRRVER